MSGAEWISRNSALLRCDSLYAYNQLIIYYYTEICASTWVLVHF